MTTPSVVAFDVIETTFSLESLGPKLAGAGLSADLLPVWFARTLRDGFALAATNTYAPFSRVAGGVLEDLAREHGQDLSTDQVREVLTGFGTLSPHEDARAAFQALKDAGIRIITLSNGAAATTRTLLQNAGLDHFIEQVLSIDDVRAFKPRAEVYHHAASAAGVDPGSMALVATHAWDVHGAKAAGLVTGFVARGQVFPATMLAPDVQGESLSAVVSGLLAP